MQPASQSTFITELHSHFEGQVGAFAYLLFVLLYFPCIATLAAAYRESSLRWAVFMVLWSTGLAYLTATLFYQLATYSSASANLNGMADNDRLDHNRCGADVSLLGRTAANVYAHQRHQTFSIGLTNAL